MIQTALPLLEPLLRLLNVDTSKVRDAFQGVKELERIVNELATIPDDFNDLFASRGWIIYDMLNLEVAKAAITKGKEDDIEAAEAILVEYYSPEAVKFLLQTLIGVKAFRPRMALAQKALLDYIEGRFHACIPVILALTDGLVNELHEKRRGFFSDQTDLQAWDSIAGHSKGLNALAKVFQTGRYSTSSEPITVPYRNGILHGMDLGYDNKIVAAKTWAALFAVRDWALQAERGELAARPEAPKPTFTAIWEQLKQTAEDKSKMDTWQPRDISFGINVPSFGLPDNYEVGSPERKLIEFITYWKSRNYGKMAIYLTHLDKKYYGNRLPKKVREHYQTKTLHSFELLKMLADGINTGIVKIKVIYKEGDKEIESIIDVNMLYEDDNGRVSVRGNEGHDWVIYNAYFE